jgi:uncharacterized Zn finger protein|tara:strand:+ start:1756 stop:2010 length:255 start_codon:yes stop_codon:yes gene_type:complete
MSTKPMKPLKKPAQKVDLSQADTMKCEKCSNYLFITSYVLKRISALISPTGQEGIVPIQVYSCGNCGHVPAKLMEGSGVEEELS